MAANSSATRGLARFCKRFVVQISTLHLPAASLSAPLAAFRRNVHGSVYDKNVDENVRPAVVPDDIIEQQSDKYWAPNPQTGFFGPAKTNEPNPVDSGGHKSHRSPVNAAESPLEEKVFFRPLEDLEKPQHP